MKVDSNAQIVDLYGKPIPKNEEGAAWTLGELIATSFLTPLKGDETMTAVDEKLEAYRFAKLFVDAIGPVELSPEDLVKVRKRVAKAFHVALAGPALEMLEGDKNGG